VERTNSSAEQDDPLLAVRETFRKDHTLDEFKSAVSQLNVYLTREKESTVGKLTDSESELLRRRLNLSDAEMREVGKSEFTSVDAHYLDECFLFQEGVQSLKLPAGDDLSRAKLTFAWIMRQVWLVERAPARPMPAGVILHMGRGNEVERMHAVLAAWQQVGLDACLLGHKNEAGVIRMWAVGARIGPEIYLFNPRQGVPMLADGANVLTLRAARAKPELLQPSVAGIEGAQDLKQWLERSSLYLAPPLSSLSARMRFLQTVLVGNQSALVSTDPAALEKRFADTSEKVEFWNPPPNLASPTRVLIHFLPLEEGGLDQAAPQFRMYYSYWQELVPWQLMPPQLRAMNQLHPLFFLPFRRLLTDRKESKEADAADQSDDSKRNRLPFIRFLTESEEAQNAATAPSEDPRRPLVKILDHCRPRDSILRGQFDDASHCLMDVLRHISHIQQLAQEPNLDAEAAKWLEQMVAAFGAMARAEKQGKLTDPAYVSAKAQVAELNQHAEKIILLIERSTAEPMAAEATYQMALCKHEQAERLQRIVGADPAERETIQKAWQNAESWWNNYLTKYGTPSPADQKKQALELKKQAHSETERWGAKQ
jgi:hypothetical protein